MVIFTSFSTATTAARTNHTGVNVNSHYNGDITPFMTTGHFHVLPYSM